ncbi:MAG: site-specific integrase [Acidobacteria bacterium]|nr:site-specific integrase [Acidobacteriota bacterium]
MSVYVRGGVWWYEFIFAGRRIRESSKSTSKTVCREAEKRRRRELERAAAGLPSEGPTERVKTVSAVLKAYEAGYAVNHRGRSVLVVKNSAAHLSRLMGSVLLADMSEQRALEFMRARQKEGASGRSINIALQVLSRAMGYTWKAVWPRLKKLEENHDIGRALEPAEEKAVLDAAAKNSSRLIFPFLYTLAWTGMRSDEARTLTWAQVNFDASDVTVGKKAKTEAGAGRRIPMSAGLRAVLEQHASWFAQNLGPTRPEWYVFPSSRTKKPTDPAKPVTSLKTAWESVRGAAGVQCRLHDLRHSFCTKLAEAGVPELTMLDMMGHVSTSMLRRYSRIRAKARRDAIDALEARQNSTGVPTNPPTTDSSAALVSSVKH